MPRIEIVVTRDPDSQNEVSVYLDGQPTLADVYHIDAGAGHQWEDWIESCAEDIIGASEAAAEELFSVAADPPGGRYIDGMPESTKLARQQLALTINSIRHAAKS